MSKNEAIKDVHKRRFAADFLVITTYKRFLKNQV